MVRLGNHIKLSGGGTPSKLNESYWGGDIPWASVKDFKSDYIDSTTDTITQEGVDNSATRVIPAGTLLVATRMAVGKVAIPYMDVAINQDLKAIACDDNLNSKYLFYLLKSKANYFDRVSSGATVKGIKINHITDIDVELPPLETQKKIASILDAADAYRQKTKALIKKYDELTQSLFLEMFGDPVTNPKGWEVSTIGECFNVKGGKRLPKGSEYETEPTEHAYIRVKDFVENGLDTTDIKYISKDIHKKISRYVISSKDVYISIAGTIGVAGYLPDYLSGANLTENAAKVTAKEGVEYRREYLSFYLNSDYAQQHIKSKTMSVGVPKLALFRIKELPYINAPEKVQTEFVDRIQKIEKQKVQAQESLEKAEELFSSLLQRAFKGGLV